MTINKLTIDEYGSLLEREFVLDDGMNIFEGNNESGKSTILSFIRFMLYGMPRKSPTTVTERDRGISWNGGVAGGQYGGVGARPKRRGSPIPNRAAWTASRLNGA